MPVFGYNIYDGFILGPKVYNKTVLPKGFHYRIEPQYGFRSNTIVGNGSLLIYRSYLRNICIRSDMESGEITFPTIPISSTNDFHPL